MKYADIFRHFGEYGFFELPNLLAFTHEKKSTVLATLHRWRKQGWIVPLRRGLYAFPEGLAKNPIMLECAANYVYKDSYVTGLWRMSQLGLIPEGVVAVTNATRNKPAEFETPFGRYVYQHLHAAGFFGYKTMVEGKTTVRVATAEKALLDFFWWKRIEWNAQEFERWRIQDPFHKLNHRRLHAFAKSWNQPRLIRAAANLTAYLAST
jgi:hypothetical protein